MFVNRNLTNMPLKFVLPSNIIIFEMVIPINMISVTPFLKTISTFLNTLKNVYYHREKLYTHASHMRRHIKTVHEGCKDFKCESFTQGGTL